MSNSIYEDGNCILWIGSMGGLNRIDRRMGTNIVPAGSGVGNQLLSILEATLPNLNGLERRERIVSERSDMPIIFLAADADIPMTAKAIKRGALEFLTTPYDAEALLNGIQHAIRRCEAALGRENQLHTLRSDYGSLTHREREVMTLVVSGLLNKPVGGELGISKITVKAHRGNVMRKMKAESFANLAHMAARLRVTRPLATIFAWN